MRRLILLRHTAIHERYNGVCYGQSDIELSAAGTAEATRLAAVYRALKLDLVLHSGLQRTRLLAEQVSVTARAEPALRERHFGAWELRTWDDIYAATGEAMLGLIDAPETWAPPGGETTYALRDRVLRWYRALPNNGTVLAVTHGGVIAALRGTLENAPVARWPDLAPGYGQAVEMV